MNKPETSERAAWEDKLDQHEISLNALLLGLSGALLAFGADYAKDVASIATLDRYCAGAAITLSSLSLSIGLWRSWLRSSAYGARLEVLTYDDQRSLGRTLQENEEAILDRARQEIRSRPGLNDEQRAILIGEADAAVSDRMFEARIAQAEAARRHAAHDRRLRRMQLLLGPQIIAFVGGALALAAVVLRRLAA
jgi:hypothetical protein